MAKSLDEGGDDFCPRGTVVEELVSDDQGVFAWQVPPGLSSSYDVDGPGEAETRQDLNRGEYGTLAAQLRVGCTPFVAMLAPRGDEYVVENLFQG